MIVVVRKLGKKGTIGGATKWEIEVGQDTLPCNRTESEGIVESSSNVCQFFYITQMSSFILRYVQMTL